MVFKHTTQRFTLKKFLLNLNIKFLEFFTKKNILFEFSTSLKQIINFFQKIMPVDNGYELIRVGSSGDGGYLVPNDLEGIAVCISPGFGKLSEFEKALNSHNIGSIIVDQEIENDTSYIKFEKYFLSTHSDESLRLISLNDLLTKMNLNNLETDLILQMDIEGDEWLILQSVEINLLKKFRIMIIEFHSLPNLQNKYVFENIMVPAINKILKDFYVVPVSILHFCLACFPS